MCCKLNKSNASQLTQQNFDFLCSEWFEDFALIARSANHESAFTADKTRDCKITKIWRRPTFCQLPLIFVLIVEIDPHLLFWLAKNKYSRVVSDLYICIGIYTTKNVFVLPDMESHLWCILTELSHIVVLKKESWPSRFLFT